MPAQGRASGACAGRRRQAPAVAGRRPLPGGPIGQPGTAHSWRAPRSGRAGSVVCARVARRERAHRTGARGHSRRPPSADRQPGPGRGRCGPCVEDRLSRRASQRAPATPEPAAEGAARRGRNENPGDDLFSQEVAPQVSSALESLTSVFGMGTGGSSPLASPGSSSIGATAIAGWGATFDWKRRFVLEPVNAGCSERGPAAC